VDLDAPAHDRAGAREGLTSGRTNFHGFAGAALPAVTSLTGMSIAVSPHIGLPAQAARPSAWHRLRHGLLTCVTDRRIVPSPRAMTRRFIVWRLVREGHPGGQRA
jgi:hypothetical protein